MWSNRKLRFTVVMLALIGANLGLWLSNRIFGFTIKYHGATFVLIFALDFGLFLGLALLGLLTAWLLAFRPEAFKRQIERSIAKRNQAGALPSVKGQNRFEPAAPQWS
jgi:hypothetical protein